MNFCDKWSGEKACEVCDDTGLGEFISSAMMTRITNAHNDNEWHLARLVNACGPDGWAPHLIHDICSHLAKDMDRPVAPKPTDKHDPMEVLSVLLEKSSAGWPFYRLLRIAQKQVDGLSTDTWRSALDDLIRIGKVRVVNPSADGHARFYSIEPFRAWNSDFA